MEVIKGASGLCVGVHRAGAIHQRMVQKYGEGLAVWSLRPDLDFVAFKKEGLGNKGIRSTNKWMVDEAIERINEELTLEMMNAGADDRLACVARILGDVVIEIP
jgi:hypothetical protein